MRFGALISPSETELFPQSAPPSHNGPVVGFLNKIPAYSRRGIPALGGSSLIRVSTN